MNRIHESSKHDELDESLQKNGTIRNGVSRPVSRLLGSRPGVSQLEDVDDPFPFGEDPNVKSIRARPTNKTGHSKLNGLKQTGATAASGQLKLVINTKPLREPEEIADLSTVADVVESKPQRWNQATTVVLEAPPIQTEAKAPIGQRKVFPMEPSTNTESPATPADSPYRSVWLEIPDGIPVFPFDGSEPRVAEQYRILRTSILLHPVKPRVVAISSGSSGDGKTLTAINFAGIMAMKSDTNVLIVEGDLRKCSIAPLLGIKSVPGLAEVLRGQATLEEAIVRAEQLPNFHVLPGGNVADNPAELLDSDVFRNLVLEIRKRFSFVVFDTTPAASVADFKLVMQVSDGVLMVVRPDHTDRDSFHRAFELVPEKRLLGAVINAFEDWFLWNKLDANYYYSGERPKAKSQPLFRWRRRKS